METFYGYQQTVLTAFKEVEDALISHQKAKEILEVQKIQVVALTQYLKLSNLRYDNGQNDYLTVLDAERRLFQSQLDEASSEGDVYLTLVNLYKALGQGWSVDTEYTLKTDNNP